MQMRRRRRRSKKTSKSEEKRKENYVTRQLVVAKSRGKISLKASYSSGGCGVVALQIIPNFSENNTSDISKPSPGNPTKAKESLMFVEETK